MLTALRDPGSSSETIALTVEQCGGVKAVADFENISQGTIYKLLNPTQPGDMKVSRLARLASRFQADAPARYFAQLAGGTYLPVPTAGDARFTELTTAALQHVGQVAGEIVEAHSPKSDGGAQFTPREARHLLAALGSLQSDVSNLIALARAIAEEEPR